MELSPIRHSLTRAFRVGLYFDSNFVVCSFRSQSLQILGAARLRLLDAIHSQGYSHSDFKRYKANMGPVL